MWNVNSQREFFLTFLGAELSTDTKYDQLNNMFQNWVENVSSDLGHVLSVTSSSLIH